MNILNSLGVFYLFQSLLSNENFVLISIVVWIY